MILKPVQLGSGHLEAEALAADKKGCKHFGPCGVGKKALYLNSFYVDRRYYITYSGIKRVFKRIAMSKGGFSRKGIFATIPYLVVEYDDGREKQCTFKYEEMVDQMIACLKHEQPQIKFVSAAAEVRLEKRERERAAKKLSVLSEKARKNIQILKKEQAFLEQRPELSTELSVAARKKRAFMRSNPSYRWVALAITLMGAVSLAYGVYSLINQSGLAMYFLLFGMAAVFTFAGLNVLPTARSNKKSVTEAVSRAQEAMQQYLTDKPDFPLPVRYAHPIVLQRMCRVIEEGKAVEIPDALETVKKDLKALNSDVEVDEEEYEEIIAIKAMFLNEDYI